MAHKLYLWSEQRQKYVDDLTQLYQLFCDKVYPIFSNPEKEAKNYEKKLWGQVMSSVGDENADPVDYADSVRDLSVEYYSTMSLMRYRNLGMWISCLCQVWEQQLYSFVLQELERERLTFDKSKIRNCYTFAKDVFKDFKQPLETMSCWDRIQELRWLVNVIKHSEGDSEEKLRKIRPHYFVTTGFNFGAKDTLELYHTTLLEETLNISLDDFKNYYNCLVTFWNELPEFMYLDEKTLVSE